MSGPGGGRRTLLVLLVLTGGLCCAPAPRAPLPITSSAPSPPASSSRKTSVWRPMTLRPSITHAAFSQPVPEGHVLVDESGVRWLLPADGTAPRSVAEVDLLPMVQWRWDDALGLVATSAERRVYASKTALGPLLPIATLPEDADAKTFAHLEGVSTIRGKNGLLMSSDGGAAWAPLPGLAGYDALSAVLDGKGRGVGLFAPETVASTRDRGATWTPIATADLSVRSLETFEGKPLLAPAGRRDRFERSVDLATGALTRVFVPRPHTPEERRRLAKVEPNFLMTGKGHPRGFRRAVGQPVPVPTAELPFVALELASDEYDAERTSTDGERALALPTLHLRRGHPGTAPLFGKLGEGFVPVGGEEHLLCEPTGGALCGDWIAVACARQINVYRASEPQKRVASLDTKARVGVAFDDKGQLLTIVGQKSGKQLTLTRYEPNDLSKSVSETVVDAPIRNAHFVGGCHRPALWVMGDGFAARWEADTARLSDATKLPSGGTFVGVSPDRELVVAAPIARALTFVPSGKTVEIGEISNASVSFTEDGRHALAAVSGRRVLASSDGGQSFRPIAAPAARTSAVLCGRERCQLGMGVYRDGFDEDETYVAPAAALPAADRPPPSPPPPASFPVVMRCVVDPSVFQGVPASSSGLTPRLGHTAFAGLDAEEGPQRRAIFGDVSGRAKALPLPSAPPRKPGQREDDDSEILIAPGAPGIAKHEFLANGSMHPRSTTTYRWDAASPLRRFVEPNTYASRFIAPELLSADAVATQNGAGDLLVWGRSAATIRPYPTLGDSGGHGVFAEDAAGTLHVAHEWGDAAARLVVVPREAPSIDRVLVARRHAIRENAIGLLPPSAPNDPWSVVLAELVENDAVELRIHALAADLSLAPPVIVPGTRTAPEHLMDLPSCGADPTGAIVRTFARGKVSIESGPQVSTGYLQRFLRVTAAGACVERTLLGHAHKGLAGQVVVVGNGGIASSQRQAGLRCEPAIVTPLSMPSPSATGTPSPSAPPPAPPAP